MPLTAAGLLNRFTLRSKFRHMQVLVGLAEFGSMRRTAECLNMTQPAVSQLLAELERLVEVPLFYRHARGVRPTDAAKDLLPVARAILDSLGEGAERIANRVNRNSGTVRISASPAAIGGLLLHALARFNEKHPGISVHVLQTSDAAALAGVSSGIADLVLTRRPPTLPDGWIFQECKSDRLAVIAGCTHPLASAARVEVAQLGEFSWIMNRVGSVAREVFENLAESGGWPEGSRSALSTQVPELTRYILASGRHLALVPYSVACPWIESGEIVEIKVDAEMILAPLGLLHSEFPSQASVLFASFVMSSV